MKIAKLPVSLLAIALWLSNVSNTYAGGLCQLQPDNQEQAAKEVLNMVEVLDHIADSINYRSIKAYKVIPDEWDTDDRKPLVVAHAYCSLFSRDPDSLLDLGPMHRGLSSKHIRTIILLFKDAEVASKETVLLRQKIEGDIGARVIKTDENGFEVRAISRSQIAVRRGAKLILLETDKQVKTMSDIAGKLEEASW